MKIKKAVSRDRKRHKRVNGMKMDNRSILVVQKGHRKVRNRKNYDGK